MASGFKDEQEDVTWDSLQTCLDIKYNHLMKEYYQKLKTPLETLNRRAQESCLFVKIPFFDGKFDYQFGKDIMDFNMGLAEIESFCNKLYPSLSGQSPINVHSVVNCIDSFPEDILAKVNKIFDGNLVAKCMELFAKDQGLDTCYLFFSHCLGLRVKILAIEILSLAYKQDSVKVITLFLMLRAKPSGKLRRLTPSFGCTLAVRLKNFFFGNKTFLFFKLES